MEEDDNFFWEPADEEYEEYEPEDEEPIDMESFSFDERCYYLQDCNDLTQIIDACEGVPPGYDGCANGGLRAIINDEERFAYQHHACHSDHRGIWMHEDNVLITNIYTVVQMEKCKFYYDCLFDKDNSPYRLLFDKGVTTSMISKQTLDISIPSEFWKDRGIDKGLDALLYSFLVATRAPTEYHTGVDKCARMVWEKTGCVKKTVLTPFCARDTCEAYMLNASHQIGDWNFSVRNYHTGVMKEVRANRHGQLWADAKTEYTFNNRLKKVLKRDDMQWYITVYEEELSSAA